MPVGEGVGSTVDRSMYGFKDGILDGLELTTFTQPATRQDLFSKEATPTQGQANYGVDRTVDCCDAAAPIIKRRRHVMSKLRKETRSLLQRKLRV
jgi:hypothetical protein